jgi:hypothetical protein
MCELRVISQAVVPTETSFFSLWFLSCRCLEPPLQPSAVQRLVPGLRPFWPGVLCSLLLTEKLRNFTLLSSLSSSQPVLCRSCRPPWRRVAGGLPACRCPHSSPLCRLPVGLHHPHQPTSCQAQYHKGGEESISPPGPRC